MDKKIIKIILIILIFILLFFNIEALQRHLINKKINSTNIKIEQFIKNETGIYIGYKDDKCIRGLEEFYKEANTRDWAVVEDVNIRSKFYKIVLDIYKNEKLDKQEKAFLSGFIEGILEYDENIDDAKDLKTEMQAAIK